MNSEHASISILFFLLAAVYVVVSSCRKADKNPPYIRKIPGVDAVFDAVGRAAEEGKSISFSTGLSSVGPVLYATLGVIAAVAHKCARYGVSLFIPQNDPAAMALVHKTTKDAYERANRIQSFDPQKITFLSEEQFAFASGYVGLVTREKVGAAFLFGSFAGESLILAEAGQRVGAMQVAASVSPEQVAFFVATCDYTLIGEEIFAASAYLTKEPLLLGSLRAQDILKVIIFIIIFSGAIFSTLKSFEFITKNPIEILLSGDQE